MGINWIRTGITCLALMVLVAGVAAAEVTFDPATGEGFIGRGDVIDTVGLGKDALVDEPVVTYNSGGTDTYSIVVEWYTGPSERQTRHELIWAATVEGGISGTVAVQTRYASGEPTADHITGYILTGYIGAPDVSDVVVTLWNSQEGTVLAALPVVGAVIEGNKSVVSVTLVDSSGGDGGLYFATSESAEAVLIQ